MCGATLLRLVPLARREVHIFDPPRAPRVTERVSVLRSMRKLSLAAEEGDLTRRRTQCVARVAPAEGGGGAVGVGSQVHFPRGAALEAQLAAGALSEEDAAAVHVCTVRRRVRQSAGTRVEGGVGNRRAGSLASPAAASPRLLVSTYVIRSAAAASEAEVGARLTRAYQARTCRLLAESTSVFF